MIDGIVRLVCWTDYVEGRVGGGGVDGRISGRLGKQTFGAIFRSKKSQSEIKL